MTKKDFVVKFNEDRENFFNDPNAKKIFDISFDGNNCSKEELCAKLINTSFQLSSAFTYKILSDVLEFDEE